MCVTYNTATVLTSTVLQKKNTFKHDRHCDVFERHRLNFILIAALTLLQLSEGGAADSEAIDQRPSLLGSVVFRSVPHQCVPNMSWFTFAKICQTRAKNHLMVSLLLHCIFFFGKTGIHATYNSFLIAFLDHS